MPCRVVTHRAARCFVLIGVRSACVAAKLGVPGVLRRGLRDGGLKPAVRVPLLTGRCVLVSACCAHVCSILHAIPACTVHAAPAPAPAPVVAPCSGFFYKNIYGWLLTAYVTNSEGPEKKKTVNPLPATFLGRARLDPMPWMYLDGAIWPLSM